MAKAEMNSGRQWLNEYFDDLLQDPHLEIEPALPQNADAEIEVQETPDEPGNLASDRTATGRVAQETTAVAARDAELSDQPVLEEKIPDSGSVLPDLVLDISPETRDWRETERFDCLLLQLAGLNLAVPLCCVDLPKPWPEGVQPLEHSCFQGHYLQDEQRRVVVHLADIIMPGRGVPMCEGIVVPMLEMPWSLRVDDLQGTRSFLRADINWNESGHKRPWLAGMVKNQPVAVIDPLKLVQQLTDKWQEMLA